MCFGEIAAGEGLARGGEVVVQGSSGCAANWDNPLLRALAEDSQQFAFGDEAVEAELTEFAHAQAAAVHHLEHRAVAQGDGIIVLDGVQHPERLLFRKDTRKDLRLFRRIHQRRGIDGQAMAFLQKAEERSNCGSPPGTRRTAAPLLSFVGEEVDDVVTTDIRGGSDRATLQVVGEQPEVLSVPRAGVRAQSAFELRGGEKVLDVRFERGSHR